MKSWQESGKVRTSYSLIPSLGTHVFRHKLTKRWIKIDRTREQHQQDITGGTPWETVTLTSLGKKACLYTKKFYFLKLCPIFVDSALCLFTKYNYFLRVCSVF